MRTLIEEKCLNMTLLFRYGEVRTASFKMIVKGKSSRSSSSSSSKHRHRFSANSSSNSDLSDFLLLASTELTTQREADDHTASSTLIDDDMEYSSSTSSSSSSSSSAVAAYSWTTPMPIEKTPEYQRQFFYLKVRKEILNECTYLYYEYILKNHFRCSCLAASVLCSPCWL